jgi:phosphoketolase
MNFAFALRSEPRIGAREWMKGYGVIRHEPETRKRVATLARRFPRAADGMSVWELLIAADRLASAAMWLTVHDTYADAVHLDGRPLALDEFKRRPEGHTGSALNIVPAYVGYLAANALTGHTRAWIAEQGHAVSGIDCVNVLVGNVTPAHERYTVDDEGLTRFVRDFYRYELLAGGGAASPRGSHVNAHTAGGILEGGYLGFAGLQYPHLPLPGERLVAFLSDGAFEEQRGSDWAPRWWRPNDCGLVAPIMILNGRRIDQRTTLAEQGGTRWLERHLALNGFDPLPFDGRDPAAYVCAILEMERLEELADPRRAPRLPYGIATTVKGYGFHGAGTNAAHNLPLGAKVDERLAERFREHAARLWVEPAALEESLAQFRRHADRPRERDHALVVRDVPDLDLPELPWRAPGESASPMDAIDELFVAACRRNPHLRPRVGNPDEMRSNRLDRTLELLEHRVTDPERGAHEALDGKVITALNEEAVACAVLANKGGLGLVATYEAFGAKMSGAIRQELIFAAQCLAAGRPQRWLSIPIVLTSHTYENGKNERSHQDPSLCEQLLGEPAHVSRVLFPFDFSTAAAALAACYRSRGSIWTLVVPKRVVPVRFDHLTAPRLVAEGALHLRKDERPRAILTAIGAYQLEQTLRASARLAERGFDHDVVAMLEPRRFADPKDDAEAAVAVAPELRERLYPPDVEPRLFVTHTRAGRIRGLLASLDTGPRSTHALGYRNRGGTLDVAGMLFVNEQSWAHVVHAAGRLAGIAPKTLLDERELDALAGRTEPLEALFGPADAR